MNNNKKNKNKINNIEVESIDDSIKKNLSASTNKSNINIQFNSSSSNNSSNNNNNYINNNNNQINPIKKNKKKRDKKKR